MKVKFTRIFSVFMLLGCLTVLYSGCAVNPNRDGTPNQTPNVNYTDNYNPGGDRGTPGDGAATPGGTPGDATPGGGLGENLTPGGVPGVMDNQGVITPVPTTTTVPRS